MSRYSATVTNLQTKVESLTTTNALMKEDLAVAKDGLLALYEENRAPRRPRRSCACRSVGSVSVILFIFFVVLNV